MSTKFIYNFEKLNKLNSLEKFKKQKSFKKLNKFSKLERPKKMKLFHPVRTVKRSK